MPRPRPVGFDTPGGFRIMSSGELPDGMKLGRNTFKGCPTRKASGPDAAAVRAEQEPDSV